MTVPLLQLPRTLTVDANGTPRSNAKLYVFAAQTTNPVQVWQDPGLTIPQPVPIRSNAEGTFPPIYADPSLGNIKINITDEEDVQIPGYPIDNIPAPFDFTQSSVATLLNPRISAEIAAGVMPTNSTYLADSYVDVRRYGGFPGAAAAINDTAIATAVKVAAVNGSVVKLAVGSWDISKTIVLAAGVFLEGYGPHTKYNAVGSRLKPTNPFTGTEVIRADSQDGGNVIMSGVGASDLGFDMTNVAAGGINGLVLRSVSNNRPCEYLVFFNYDVGNAIRMEISAQAGALPNDGCEFRSCFTYGTNGSNIATQTPKLFVSDTNETAFRNCKFQTADTIFIANKPAAEVGKNVLGLTFDQCAFAGVDYGCVIRNNDTDGPAEHVRFLNNIFEGTHYGVYVRGPLTAGVNFYSKRICVEPGNRFLTSQGPDPRCVVFDKCLSSKAYLDDFISAGASGTPYLAEISLNAIGNVVDVGPGDPVAQVLNGAPALNMVIGRKSNAFDPVVLYAELIIAPTLINSWAQFSASNRSAVGYWKDRMGVVHLQGHISTGTVTTAAFVLPAGYLPAKTKEFAVNSNGAFGSVTVDPATGNVIPQVGNNTFFSLDGINFRAGD